MKSHRQLSLAMVSLAVVLSSGCATYVGTGSQTVKFIDDADGVRLVAADKILFDSGKTDIKPEGHVFIHNAVHILEYRTKAPIEIEGHTDNVGSEEYNLKLSQDRADTVEKAMLDEGFPKSRIASVKGFGATKPLNQNLTDEDRAQNRRTTILVRGVSRAQLGGTRVLEGLSNIGHAVRLKFANIVNSL